MVELADDRAVEVLSDELKRNFGQVILAP